MSGGDTEIIAEQNGWDGATKEAVFEGNGFRIIYKLQDYWSGGYNSSVVVENTGDKVIENWV